MKWSVLFVVFGFFLAGCASPAQTTGPVQEVPSASQEQVFTIGAIGPLTGDAAVYGLPMQRVMMKAVEDLNLQWAEKNMRLNIIFEDGLCNGKDALSAAQKLVNVDGVTVLTTTCSGETLGVASFANQNSVIIFSSVSSSPDVTSAGDYVFRNYPSDTAQVNHMIAFAKENGYVKIAILSETTDYAQGLRNYLLANLPEEMEIVSDEKISSEARDVRSEISKIRSVNPDLIIILPQTIPMAGLIYKQLFESGNVIPVVGSDSVGVDQTIHEYPAELEGTYAVRGMFAKEQSGEFITLKTETDCELSLYCATIYDGVFILAQALEACGDKDSACIKERLYATQNWEGLAGMTSFDQNGDVGGQFVLLHAENGAWVPVE